MRTWMVSLAPGLLVPSLAIALLPGCSRSDLSDYHPIEKSKTQTKINESVPNPTDAATPKETPVTASADDTSSRPELDLPVSALVPVNVVDGASVANLMKVVPPESSANANPIQPASATAATEKPRTVELLVPEKTFLRDASSKALRVSYDDLDLLKVLNLEPVTENAVELMPEWLRNLNGQRVRIRGFMYPTFEAEGIERFVLARDNQICCFGRDPKVYDLVQVDLRAGKTTKYIPATRAFDVIGRFKIELISEDGKPYGLYYIDDAELIDK